jgi:hypothetical protein
MAVSRAMRRLLRVLDIQEEQSRTALESALAELHQLERAQALAVERGRGGRRLVTSSALRMQRSALFGEQVSEQTREQLVDRLAGLEESLAASRAVTVLAAHAVEAERNVTERREEFLSKRIERRQAESLIRKVEAADAVEAGRRGQRSLDDWYLNRLHRAGADAEGQKEE